MSYEIKTLDVKKRTGVSVIKLTRGFIVYLLNLIVATIGTKIVEAPADKIVHFSDRTSAVVLEADILTSATALGLGYFVYSKWQSASAAWTWVAGVCWFVIGALHLAGNKHGTVLWELSRSHALLDVDNFASWSEFTLPLLRTIFYSLGAFFCFNIKRHLLRKHLVMKRE